MTNSWSEGDIVSIDSAEPEKVTILTKSGKRIKMHQMYCFIWGEDPLLYAQRLERAFFAQ